MSQEHDPRLETAVVSDETLLEAHEQLLERQPEDNANYRLLPLVLLSVFSALIFWGGTYLNRYSGRFNPVVFNEDAKPAPNGPVVAQVNPLVLGKANFALVCSTCHQATGLGQPGVYPPLVGSEWVNGSEERIIRIVLYGLKGPITVKGVTYNAAAMPVFRRGTGYNWTDDKVAAVISYVRQEWGNSAPAVSPEKVAEIRNQIGNRAEFTAEELLQVP